MDFMSLMADCGAKMEQLPGRRWMDVKDGNVIVKTSARWPTLKRPKRCKALRKVLESAWQEQPISADARNGLLWLRAQAEVWRYDHLTKLVDRVIEAANKQLVQWQPQDPLVQKHFKLRETQFHQLCKKVEGLSALFVGKQPKTQQQLLEEWEKARAEQDDARRKEVEKTLRYFYTPLKEAIEIASSLKEDEPGPLLDYVTEVLTLGADWLYDKEIRKIPDFLLFRILKSDHLGTDEANVWHKLRYMYPRVHTWPKDTILKLCRFAEMDLGTWPEFEKTRHFKRWLTEEGRQAVHEARKAPLPDRDPRGILRARFVEGAWQIEVKDVLDYITTLEPDGSKTNPHFLLFMPDNSFALSLWKEEKEGIQLLRVEVEPLERWGRGYTETSGNGEYPMTDGELWICYPPSLRFEKKRWPKLFEKIGKVVDEIREAKPASPYLLEHYERIEYRQRFRLAGGQKRSKLFAVWQKSELKRLVDQFWLPKFERKLKEAINLMNSTTA